MNTVGMDDVDVDEDVDGARRVQRGQEHRAPGTGQGRHWRWAEAREAGR